MQTTFKPATDLKSKIIEIYTDGACRSSAVNKGDKTGKKDLSAYGYFIQQGGKELLDGKAELGRTNNYMEIKAVVESLKKIQDKNQPVQIYSDSEYVVNSINKNWARAWKKNGWKKKDGKAPVNAELWKELLEEWDNFAFISIDHVKGHSGNPGNELVDKYVNKLMDALKEEVNVVSTVPPKGESFENEEQENIEVDDDPVDKEQLAEYDHLSSDEIDKARLLYKKGSREYYVLKPLLDKALLMLEAHDMYIEKDALAWVLNNFYLKNDGENNG